MQLYAHALDLADISARLAAMPRETPNGLRDDTLLVRALHTGRRAMELASPRCGHLHVTTRAITVH